jgi:PKD repeat protein
MPAMLLAWAVLCGAFERSRAEVVVEPPGAMVAGKTIGEWTAAWWQWAAALAPPGDPFTDTTGAYARVDQSGPVFFLAGSPGGSNSRNIDVPTNTYVLVPLLATEWSQLELGFDKTAAEIRQAAREQANQIDRLHATLDGTPIALSELLAHREVSPDFQFVAVADNQVGINAVGSSGIAVADGYFLMIAPMTPGTHVLNYGGGASPFGIFLNETDTITVAVPATRYVDVNSADPTPPYTDWRTAATTIQEAVDAAAPGDHILVTNGIYQAGGRALADAGGANRVAVTKAVAIESVNGPALTVIQGYQVPGTTNGPGAIRCVYLADGASLSGFTLTNGATVVGRNGGGVWCQSASALVTNCVLVGNSARAYGGGAAGGTLINCTLASNSAALRGGGVFVGTLIGCTLVGNTSDSEGGGAYSGSLSNCTLAGNSAGSGGGANGSALINCTLRDNEAFYGGGTYGGTLNACELYGNAASSGGGAYGGFQWPCTLNNCTIIRNSAGEYGGGVYDSTLNNCIVYFNEAPGSPNYFGGTLRYSCTTPQPGGIGNTSADPQLASSSHLSGSSPCRGAGRAAHASGTDIDGEAWLDPPSMGCDEYHAGDVTGPLSVSMTATLAAVLPSYPVAFTALVQGQTTASVWDFGDGVVVSNQPYASHAWTTIGDYAVVLRAYNDSHPSGISATVTVQVVTQPVHYVAAGGSNPVSPYTSWATAATNIQDAVDAATVPGSMVLVTDGVYASGGRALHGSLSNRVAVDRLLELRSVNGPAMTIIHGSQVPGTTNGDGAIRCVYLANGASLSGFTLTNGATRDYASSDSSRERHGGGVWCESAALVVSNCVLTGNSAQEFGGGAYRGTLYNCVLKGNSAGYGGGVSGGTLVNCAITGNSAVLGGGAESSDLINCTLTGNWAGLGGGAYSSRLNNCLAYYNSAVDGVPNYAGALFNHCCTTPLPEDGVGNISADPQLASAVHLSAGSPCRGAGNAAYATGADIDGEPWLDPPSIGSDELHSGGVTGSLAVSVAATFTDVPTGFPVDFTAVIGGRATASVWDFGDGARLTNRPYATHAWTTVGDYAVTLTAYNDSHPAGISATVTVQVVTQPIHYVAVNSINPEPPYASWATAATKIQDAVDVVNVPGSLVLVADGTYAVGGREAGYAPNRVAVEKLLTVQSVNGPTSTVIDGNHEFRCVYLTSGARLTGFTLTNGVADSGGGLLCGSPATVVSNCVIAGNSATGAGGGSSGGNLNNCLITGNTATFEGGGAAGGVLNHCTLVGNLVTDDGSSGWYVAGGGAYGATLSHCTLAGNSALVGGGAEGGVLADCQLTGNSAVEGGGAYGSTLNNCTLTGNSATRGGGVMYGTLNNCIAYFNTAPTFPNHGDAVLNYSCTTPPPSGGVGNIITAPRFVDQVGGNFRLQADSPCINSGFSASAPTGLDLDGNPRIAGGAVDIGAYEFQSPSSVLSYAWAQRYGLPTDGSADYADSDSDRLNNWQEWTAGTIPTDAASALRLLDPSPASLGVVVTWQSVTNRTYFLERAVALGVPSAFSVTASNIVGRVGTTSYTDTNATRLAPQFYRVRVQP